MRSVTLCEPGRIEIHDQPKPNPRQGEVVIRVRCATTCGTDLKAYRSGHPYIPMPGPFGHEYSGEVAAIGKGVTEFKEGDEIMGVHSAPCGECFWCQRGQENLCESIMDTKALGSFAEYLRLPGRIVEKNLYQKPAKVDFQRACLLEPLACVANALNRLRFDTPLTPPPNPLPISPSSKQGGGMDAAPIENAVVIGTGAIAILFNAALTHLGVKEVWLAGRNHRRIGRLASVLNAIPTSDLKGILDERTQGRGFDLAIDAAGTVKTWGIALNSVRRGGVAMLFGGCPSGSKVEIETDRLHYDDLTVISPFHFDPAAVRIAREWLLDPDFEPGPIITAEATLEEAPQVFRSLADGREIKVAFLA